MATFGKTTTSGSYDNDGGGNQRGSKFVLTEEGNLSKISMHSRVGSAGSVNVKCGIFLDNGSNTPTTFKGATNAVAISNTTAQWNDFTFATELYLPAATYWIVWLSESNTLYHQFNADALTNGHAYAGATYPNFTDPFGTPSYQNWEVSIYATYTAGGPPTSIFLDMWVPKTNQPYLEKEGMVNY